MFISSCQDKAPACTQADSGCIATNVAVSNAVPCSVAAAYCHSFPLSQEFMQRIIAQKPTLCENEAFSCEAGPALIHDFCLRLGNKVEHLGAHDLDDITLPGLQVGSVTH